MESNDIIQPMTGKKVCYNIGHDDLVDFANLIIKFPAAEGRCRVRVLHQNRGEGSSSCV